MKKILFTALASFMLIAIFAFKSETKSNQTEKDYSLARVSKVSGKYIFLNCEPIQDYDVVYELSGFTLGHFNSPNEIVNYVVKIAKKREDKEGKEYDALIIGSSKYDLAIKFKK